MAVLACKQQSSAQLVALAFVSAADRQRHRRKKTVKRLLKFPSSSNAMDAISPTTQLTALQLAIKRKWTSLAHRFIAAGRLAASAGLASRPGRLNALPACMQARPLMWQAPARQR